MFIHKMFINDFRQFKEAEIRLGKYVTAISGYNATGKSTVLSLLGQIGMLAKEKTLLGKDFNIDLEEIIKLDIKNDISCPDVFTVYMSEPLQNEPESISFRSTWQKIRNQDKNRFRMIPRKVKDTRNHEGKIKWPVQYLSLLRLYPVGDSAHAVENEYLKKLTPSDNEYLINSVAEILSLTSLEKEKIDSCSVIDIDSSKVKPFGVNTKDYTSLCNSAGQSNLGQIILTVLSFKNLKKKLGVSNWAGGLILIDEIDATLHPSAQNKLLDFLYREAKEINLQVVFTTHSLSLLDFICNKTLFNSESNVNEYEVSYITNANAEIKVIPNPTFQTLYANLMVAVPTSRKISVFSEDEEARIVIKLLLKWYQQRYNIFINVTILDISMGWQELLKLLKQDIHNFSNYIFVFDGDISTDERNKQDCYYNITYLPGTQRPEQLIYNYIIEAAKNPNSQYSKSNLADIYSLRYMEDNGPSSYKDCKPREQYKKWFIKHNHILADVINWWIDDNESVVLDFLEGFVKQYNFIAKKNFLPMIVKK